jgi:hypothetical protein
MSKLVAPSPSGDKLVDAKAAAAIDKIYELKKKNDLWGVFNLLLDIWTSKKRGNYESLLMDTRRIRKTRASKFGSSKDRTLRYTLDVPQEVLLMLRKVYSVEELPMDKRFFYEVWKRYPQLRIAEKY